MQSFPNLFVVSVTGNIAAGKTTLINALKAEFKEGYPVHFLREMHELPDSKSAQLAPAYFAISRSDARIQPADPNGESLLELEFQLAVLADLHTELARLSAEACKSGKLQLVILERGWVDVAVFSELLFGKDSRQVKTIQDQIDVLFQTYADLTIFIHSDCEVNFLRAKKRAEADKAQDATIQKFGDSIVFGMIEILYNDRFRYCQASKSANIAHYFYEPNPIEVSQRINDYFNGYIREAERLALNLANVVEALAADWDKEQETPLYVIPKSGTCYECGTVVSPKGEPERHKVTSDNRIYYNIMGNKFSCTKCGHSWYEQTDSKPAIPEIDSKAIDPTNPMVGIGKREPKISLYNRIHTELLSIKYISSTPTGYLGATEVLRQSQELLDKYYKRIIDTLLDTRAQALKDYAEQLKNGYTVEFILHEESTCNWYNAPAHLNPENMRKLVIEPNILKSASKPIFYSLALCDTFGVVLGYYITFAFCVGENCALEIVSWDWYKERQKSIEEEVKVVEKLPEHDIKFRRVLVQGTPPNKGLAPIPRIEGSTFKYTFNVDALDFEQRLYFAFSEFLACEMKDLAEQHGCEVDMLYFPYNGEPILPKPIEEYLKSNPVQIPIGQVICVVQPKNSDIQSSYYGFWGNKLQIMVNASNMAEFNRRMIGLNLNLPNE